MESPIVDVVIPAARSTAGLGATLASLAAQRYPAFRATVDISPGLEAGASLDALVRLLEARGHPAHLEASASGGGGPIRDLNRLRGSAPYLLVVEEGVFLEPDLIGRLVAAMRSTPSGFVGSSAVSLDARSERAARGPAGISFWDGPVRPEVLSEAAQAERRRLHRGASLQDLRERLPRTRDRLYRIADIDGCVLYDTEKLRSVGGFPAVEPGSADHRAGDVGSGLPDPGQGVVQRRLLARHGGAGLFPSGAFRLVPAVAMAAPTVLGDAGGDRPAVEGSRRLSRGHLLLRTRQPRRPIARHRRRVAGRRGRHGSASRVRPALAPR
ncbi:MAG: hypothetical protein HYX57_10960 [Chloroflexi bacterium]|nr:hypothetical protein [Chloroflexota bacterium]